MPSAYLHCLWSNCCDIACQFSDSVFGLNEGKSGEANTEVNKEKFPLNNVTAVPEKSTTEFKQIVDHEINHNVMNSTSADSLGKENYLDSNQSNVGLGLRGKLWHHGTAHPSIVDSQQKPYNQVDLNVILFYFIFSFSGGFSQENGYTLNSTYKNVCISQTSQVLSGSEQRHMGQCNNNVSNIIMSPEQG